MNIIIAITISIFLSSCVTGVIIGTTATGIANDKRPIGQQMDDSIMESRISTSLLAEKKIPSRNISVYTVDGTSYLTGYVSTEKQLQKVKEIVKRKTKNSVSYLQIVRPSSLDYLTSALITTKIKYQILKNKGISGIGIRVETVLKTIYVFGVIESTYQATLVMEAIGEATIDENDYTVVDNMMISPK